MARPAILIVEEDAALRRRLRRVLVSEGIEVIDASDGSEAVRSESTVLVTGETGTGRELAAALIHQGSRRRQQPFVHINCAAIPDTLLRASS